MLIVTLIIALLAGIAYPSAAAGIESMRLRSAGNDIASFLTAAADQAERREQMVEIWISAKDNALIARSPDLGFARRYDLPQAIRITSILPAAEAGPDEPRRFLLYPGGTVPRIGVEIVSESGRKRMIVVDPLSGLPRNEAEGQ